MAILDILAVVIKVLVSKGHEDMLRVTRYALRDAAKATATTPKGSLVRFDLVDGAGKVKKQVWVRVSAGYKASYGLGEGAFDNVRLVVGTAATKAAVDKPAIITDGVEYNWNDGRNAINTLLDNAPKKAGATGRKTDAYKNTD